ncbi:MAG: hypothetical protein ABSB96_05795 [Gaiellaceae bacterium]
MPRRKLTTVLAVALIIAGVAAAGALATPRALLANSWTYQDTAGDTGAAPDITAVSISNDDTGAITLTVAIANRPQLGATDDIAVFIDHDRDEDTGAENAGWDYVLDMDAGGTRLFTIDEDWDVTRVGAPTLVGRYENGAAIFQINRSDLGATGCFNFYARTVTPQNAFEYVRDDAPNGDDYWTYRLNLPIAQVGIAISRLSLGKARAGGSFQVKTRVSRADTGRRVNGQVTCLARVGGKSLRKSGRSTNGVASCAWKLPKNARGKWLGGSVSVSCQGAQAKRSFAVKVS